MTFPLRIFVADDSHVIRGLVANLVHESDDMELAGEAADGMAAVDLAQKVRPDVVVLDLQMPRMSGLQALRTLRQRLPETHVVILTNYGDAVYRRTCLEAGAAHFLDKSSDLDGIVDVLCSLGRTPA